jgi:probable rRNA maturation factor
MTVEISEPPQPTSPLTAVDVHEIVAFAAATLAREGVDVDARLSLAFVDADRIADLNRRFMGKEGPTDVLSFPIEDATPGHPPRIEAGGPPLLLGDVVIAPDVVAVNATDHGVTFEDELYLMVCHGVLHILGWDHQTDAEAQLMESREAEHLATVGRVRR